MPARIDSGELTSLLVAAHEGVPGALDTIFPLVYEELRRLAQSARRQSSYETLNTTALVHEAYLKLAGSDAGWTSRKHFYTLAAKVMRQIVLSYARRQQAQKRGGTRERIDLDEAEAAGEVSGSGAAAQALAGSPLSDSQAEELLTLDEALAAVSQQHERLGQVIEMRFFGGFSIAETAALLDVSTATVRRDWTLGRALLYQQVKALRAG